MFTPSLCTSKFLTATKHKTAKFKSCKMSKIKKLRQIFHGLYGIIFLIVTLLDASVGNLILCFSNDLNLIWGSIYLKYIGSSRGQFHKCSNAGVKMPKYIFWETR